jgi:glycogen(starch) synthase
MGPAGGSLKVRVLLVANTLPPRDISGVGEQVLQLASGLRARGHEVEVLGRGEDGAPGPKVLFPLTVAPAFVRRLRDFRPHVVQVHESDGVLVALLTRVLAAVLDPRPLLVALLQVSYVKEIEAVRPLRSGGVVLGRPGAVELRFRYVKAPLQVVFGAFTAWLSDLVLAPSEVTAGEIRRDYRVDRLAVVPNVTGGLSWDGPGDREPGAGTAGSKVGAGYLLYVGRLRIRKGVEILLDALSILKRDGIACRLLVAGDGEQRKSLERFVRKRELESYVDFLGRKSPQEVRELLAASRALVVPSIYEGMPLVVLEAMERAVPVIASAVSGIPEVVVDGETGWLVEQENSSALAHALGAVLEDRAEAERRGRAGRSRVDARYRPANAAVLWESEMNELRYHRRDS